MAEKMTVLQYVTQNFPTHGDSHLEEMRRTAVVELEALETELAQLRTQAGTPQGQSTLK